MFFFDSDTINFIFADYSYDYYIMEKSFVGKLFDIRKKKGLIFTSLLIIVIVIVAILSFGTLIYPIIMMMFPLDKPIYEKTHIQNNNEDAYMMFALALRHISNHENIVNDDLYKIVDLKNNTFGGLLFVCYVSSLYNQYQQTNKLNEVSEDYKKILKFSYRDGTVGKYIDDFEFSIEHSKNIWETTNDQQFNIFAVNPYHVLYKLRYIIFIYIKNLHIKNMSITDYKEYVNETIEKIDFDFDIFHKSFNMVDDLIKYLYIIEEIPNDMWKDDYIVEFFDMVNLLSTEDSIKKWHAENINVDDEIGPIKSVDTSKTRLKIPENFNRFKEIRDKNMELLGIEPKTRGTPTEGPPILKRIKKHKKYKQK
jgi:hypothetical protein